jgi:anti-sigma factor RsiW
MNHDPEQLAAAYLTTMGSRARRRFEAHLLACEPCWQEVSLGCRGRQLAQTARAAAPAQLRKDIRAAVEAIATQPGASPRPLRRTIAAAAIALAVVAGAAVLARPWPHGRPSASPAPPAVIAAAVTSYRAGRLPGTAVSAGPAPQLTPLHLRLVGAAAGRLTGVAVTMFAYRTPSGARLIVVRAGQPFPEAAHAREVIGTADAWTVRSNGVTVICAQGTHAMLLLGTDPALVRHASALLNAI